MEMLFLYTIIWEYFAWAEEVYYFIYSIYAFSLYFIMLSLTYYKFSWLKICSIVHMEALRRMICTSARKLLLVRTRMKCQFLCRSAGAQVTLKSPGLSLLCKI